MADPYDPITGEPLLHLGPKDDVHYDEDRDEWVSHQPPAEPVPAAEPPTECDDCYLLTARDAEKRGLLISDAAVMLCPQHVETVTETP